MSYHYGQKIEYTSINDDLMQTHDQNYEVKADFQWTHTNQTYLFFRGIMQHLISWFAWPFERLWLSVRVVNGGSLKPYRHQAIYLYGNHTQPQGDVFLPYYLHANVSVIISPANMGIPILGKLMPLAGAIPTPKNTHQFKNFIHVIKTRVRQGSWIVLYPEAHLWPYYTKIRPMNAAAFHYPINKTAPVFCMTTTYQRPNREGHKPKLTIYIDGPFSTNQQLSKKEQQSDLQQQVQQCMQTRSKHSNYEFLDYEKRRIK